MFVRQRERLLIPHWSCYKMPQKPAVTTKAQRLLPIERHRVVIFGFGRAAHWLSPRPPVGSLTWCDRAKRGHSSPWIYCSNTAQAAWRCCGLAYGPAAITSNIASAQISLTLQGAAAYHTWLISALFYLQIDMSDGIRSYQTRMCVSCTVNTDHFP